VTYISDSGYGVASTGNTTTSTLTGGATFTGTAEQNAFSDVMCSCYADVSGTLYFDFSVNGTDWRTFPSAGFKVSGGIHEFHTAVKGPRYFRVRFVNDATAQTTLQLYTYYGTFRQGNTPLNQTIGRDHDAVISRNTVAQDEITEGRRSGVNQWNKFGYRSNLQSSGGDETIWASSTTSNNLAIMTSADTFDISYNSTTDGAAGGATGATKITFYYLDANEELAIFEHTLGSTGTDTTSFTGLGINRAVVTASGTNNTNVNTITITNTTLGNDQAIIPAGEGVTQQAFFFMPNNARGAAKWLFLSANKLSGSNPKITFKGFVYNRTVDSKFLVFRYIMDTQSENHITIEDPCNFRLSPRDVLFFTADTDQNNTTCDCRFSLNVYDEE